MLIKLILWHWKMVIKETFELASDKVCYDNGGWHICHKDQSLASLPLPVFATSRPVAVGQSERYFQRWNRVGTHLRNNPKHRDQASSLLTTPLCEQQKWGLDRTELAFFCIKRRNKDMKFVFFMWPFCSCSRQTIAKSQNQNHAPSPCSYPWSVFILHYLSKQTF